MNRNTTRRTKGATMFTHLKWLAALGLAILVLLVPTAIAQKAANVRAVLVTGVQDQADLPANMKGIQNLLEKNLAGRFKGYRLVGRGAADIAPSKNGKIALPNSNVVDVTVTKIEAGKIHLAIKWDEKGKTVAKMTLAAGKDPMIIGGPKGNGGNQILLLQAK